MEERGQQFTRILSAGSLLLGLVVGSYLLFEKPFQSERVSSGLSPSILESRLWEDPFTPILALEARIEQSYQSGSAVPASLYKQLTVAPARFSAEVIDAADREPPIVLGVLLPGGRFALSSETRRRTRYAVISALNKTHIPINSEAISILCIGGSALDRDCASTGADDPVAANDSAAAEFAGSVDSGGFVASVETADLAEFTQAQAGTSGSTPDSKQLMISYEIFEPYPVSGMQESNAKGFEFGSRDVIVFWIPENALGNKISNKYSDVLAAIGVKSAEYSRHVLLGPTNSNVLQDLIEERCNPTCSTAGSWIEPVQDSIDRLIASADSYLDMGLSEEKRLELSNCLLERASETVLRKQVTDCLQSLRISDTNASWHLTLATDWPTAEVVDAMKPLAPSMQQSVQSLIYRANSYLDKGLQDDKSLQLIECIGSSGVERLLREPATQCLQNLAIADSNPTWYNTIGMDWPTVEVAAAMPESMQQPVQDLLEKVNRYLDAGLAADKRKEFLSCLAAPAVQELTREFVSACLKNLRIRHKDPNWYASVTRDWKEPDADTVTIISPRATISRDAVNKALGVNLIESDLKIIRSIPDDKALVQTLFAELVRRKLDAKSAKIALVYEADGKYGRGISDLIRCTGTVLGQQCTNKFNQVINYGYLRGIDGLRSNESSDSSLTQSQEAKTFESMLNMRGDLEDPFGNHQYDYLRRLAREVSAERFDVIGVVGTDVYDKLLVLQALREENPEALFITTDLDSYLSQQTQFDWTHNLLVASSFALDADDVRNPCLYEQNSGGQTATDASQTRRDIHMPPFRDSYQTSYFYSTCAALRLPELNAEQTASLVGSMRNKTFLFEIGRDGAVQLQIPDGIPAVDLPALLSSGQPRKEAPSLLALGFLMAPVLTVLVASRMALNARKYSLFSRGNTLYMSFYLALSGVFGLLLMQQLPEVKTGTWPSWWWTVFKTVFFGGAAAVAALLMAAMSIKKQRWHTRPWSEETALVHCVWLALITVLAVLQLMVVEYLVPGGEPVVLLQGISHWPTTILWIQILVLSICFTHFAYSRVIANNRLIQPLILAQDETPPATRRKRCSVSGWFAEIEHDNRRMRAQKSLADIWYCYRELGESSRRRLLRVLMKTIIATAILLVTDFFSEQPALARTSYPLANFLFHPWLQGGGWRELANFESVVTFVSIFMIIYATDSTRLGRAFIRALREYELQWKNFDISCFHINSFKDDDNHETNIRVCILELIALRTAAITPLVLFPFLILSLMIVSRSAIFEGWQWSLELVIVYAGLFGYVLYHALMLQREASLTRKKELEFLHALPLKTEIWKLEKPERDKQEMYLKAAVSHVTNMDGGAFVAWYKHPIFQAIILPTSGTSGLFLLQGFF